VKLLLDTHTFIWWDSAPAKLSAAALALCGDPANQLVLSVASLWVSGDPVLKSYSVDIRW
jgi:PIN domain nuclease of toxin-antitoxin system